MKRFLSILLSLCLVCSLCACGAQDGHAENTATTVFTDSTGREISVPENIERIAVSGTMAQIVVFAIAPDKLVGISSEWDAAATDFIDEKYLNLPVLGQLYGGKGELNKEELLSAAPDVVIDVGESKGDIAADMDDLQQQTGIPFIHIEAALDTLPDAYRMLGKLLGCEQSGEKLADYCGKVYTQGVDIAEKADKANLLYIVGSEGLNVIAASSYQGQLVDLVSNNVAVVDEPSSKGIGNEVDMEQILNWNPDVIVFAPDSIYDTVGNDENWQTISAIKNGTYYQVPNGPYNWMGFPPSAQRLLGMMWLESVLYPDIADYDLYDEVSEYFQMFYHCDLSREQFDSLTTNSTNSTIK